MVWIATGTWWGLGNVEPLAQAIGTYKLFAHLQLDWLVNNLQTDRAVKMVMWSDYCVLLTKGRRCNWLDVLDCRPKRTFPWSTRIMLFFWPSTSTVSASSGAHCAILLTMSRPCRNCDRRVIRFTITCFFLCVVYDVVAWVAKALGVNIVINFYLKYLQPFCPSGDFGSFLKKDPQTRQCFESSTKCSWLILVLKV